MIRKINSLVIGLMLPALWAVTAQAGEWVRAPELDVAITPPTAIVAGFRADMPADAPPVATALAQNVGDFGFHVRTNALLLAIPGELPKSVVTFASIGSNTYGWRWNPHGGNPLHTGSINERLEYYTTHMCNAYASADPSLGGAAFATTHDAAPGLPPAPGPTADSHIAIVIDPAMAVRFHTPGATCTPGVTGVPTGFVGINCTHMTPAVTTRFGGVTTGSPFAPATLLINVSGVGIVWDIIDGVPVPVGIRETYASFTGGVSNPSGLAVNTESTGTDDTHFAFPQFRWDPLTAPVVDDPIIIRLGSMRG